MIPALGAGGPGFKSRLSPTIFCVLIKTMKFLSLHDRNRIAGALKSMIVNSVSSYSYIFIFLKFIFGIIPRSCRLRFITFWWINCFIIHSMWTVTQHKTSNMCAHTQRTIFWKMSKMLEFLQRLWWIQQLEILFWHMAILIKFFRNSNNNVSVVFIIWIWC